MRKAFALGMTRLLALMLAASFIGALPIRAAPGFFSGAQEPTSGLSSQSIEAIRRQHLANSNVPRFYLHYLGSLLRGDLGNSQSLTQPGRQLPAGRLPAHPPT